MRFAPTSPNTVYSPKMYCYDVIFLPSGHADNAKDCSCQRIVLPLIPDLSQENIELVNQDVCPTCRCDYQRRNLTLIFIVVTLICIIIVTFIVYLFIVKFLWPRFIVPMTYKEQTDEIGMYIAFRPVVHFLPLERVDLWNVNWRISP